MPGPDVGKEQLPPVRHWVNVPYDTNREPSSQPQLTNENEATMRAVNNQEATPSPAPSRPHGSKFSVTGRGNAFAQKGDDEIQTEHREHPNPGHRGG